MVERLCLYQVWNSRYGMPLDEGRVSFQFHHDEENYARDRYTLITTATKTTPPWSGERKKKKSKLTSWE